MVSNNDSPSTPLSYLDFEIEIRARNQRQDFLVSVRSPMGHAEGTMRFPFTEAQLEQYLEDIGEIDVSSMQEFGRQLFEALLSDTCGHLYYESRGEAEQQGKGLRLKLRILCPWLASLPWELLYDRREDDFVCLSHHTPIVRFEAIPRPIPPLTLTGSLRILVVLSSPLDLVELNVAHERKLIEDAITELPQQLAVTLKVLEQPTWSELQAVLAEEAWHVFHFVGHGGFDEESQEGYIALVDGDAQQNAYYLKATDLARLLADERLSLRLVLLNACEGARGSLQKPFSSTAAKLVYKGIPAVLAMQEGITDQAAIQLAKTFYQSLADGMPVDMALGEARKAMSLAEPKKAEWSIPILYMSSPDGVLFTMAGKKQPPKRGEACRSRGSVPLAVPRLASPRFFICYKRHAAPDQRLANYLYDYLSRQGHQVFMDKTMQAGQAWLEEIDRQIEKSDFLIALLSQQSVNSEMVQAEVRRAHKYRKIQGHPQTLPVYVAYNGLLPYSIDAFLNQLQYIRWQSEADSEGIAQQILAVTSGQALNQPVIPPPLGQAKEPAPELHAEDGQAIADSEAQTLHPPLPEFDPRLLEQLAVPGGAVRLRDKLYIERPADARLKPQLMKYGSMTTIRAPRQTGKSSLLVRGIHHARQRGFEVVHLDMQRIDRETLESMDLFLHSLASHIVRKLHLDMAFVTRFWQSSAGPQDKLTSLMEDYILEERDKPFIFAMDEVDRLLHSDFHNDFFALLRSWYNSAAYDERWEMLNIVLVISTEPYLLIQDVNQSPFNMGLKLYLADFNEQQLRDLNRRHGSPVQARDFADFMRLLHGHPYLTRKAFYTLVTERLSWAQLTRVAAAGSGPFADHLRQLHWQLSHDQQLKEALKEVIQYNRCQDDNSLFRLLRAGLIKGSGNFYECRCDLYRLYFEDKL